MSQSTKDPALRMIPALWGIDAAVAALCWSISATEHMQVTIVPAGPILLLVAGVWVYTVLSRLRAAIRRHSGWYHDYYENHAVPILLMALGVAAAGVWMLCYYVGRHVLAYAYIPAFFLFMSTWPLGGALRGLCKSLAFGFACLVPAFSLSFEHPPIAMLFCSPCWYIGVLFFLFQQERKKWQEEDGGVHRHSGLLLIGLFCLLLVCSLAFDTKPHFEHSMCLTIAMGAACLLLLAKIRPNLGSHAMFCLCWPVMTLPALLSILLFTPEP